MFPFVFYDSPNTKPKHVEVDGLLSPEVSNKVNHSPQGFRCLSPTCCPEKSGTQPQRVAIFSPLSMETDRHIQCTSYLLFWTPPFAQNTVPLLSALRPILDDKCR